MDVKMRLADGMPLVRVEAAKKRVAKHGSPTTRKMEPAWESVENDGVIAPEDRGGDVLLDCSARARRAARQGPVCPRLQSNRVDVPWRVAEGEREGECLLSNHPQNVGGSARPRGAELAPMSGDRSGDRRGLSSPRRAIVVSSGPRKREARNTPKLNGGRTSISAYLWVKQPPVNTHG